MSANISRRGPWDGEKGQLHAGRGLQAAHLQLEGRRAGHCVWMKAGGFISALHQHFESLN